MTRITQQQLESYLWGAATLLRGTIDAGDYKQFIFPLLFYKRLCDVYDEETRNALLESGGNEEFAAFPENHRFQIPEEAHWGEVRKVAKNVGVALQNAMRSIETANPDKLFGIFGDAQWTNKDRLPDSMLRDLIEHFSSLELSIENLPEDELGNGYEYLIKKFADDSGHTAAEFYTNRTVVHLMTELLQPESGESVYDPTCGSGGMLLSCIAHLRRQNKEWRNMRLFGQERNLMTSAIARMNCFLHGIEDFRIERGDTLAEPKFVQRDRLQQFDIVLANPPYSIKQWDRESFASDPWGRNMFGTPPQGRADYAFWQHIIRSMNPSKGRCAILFPHGVLFRQEEAEMRKKLIEADLIECVIGLGPNLFYNSPMEACVVICRMIKPEKRRKKILFINAIDEVTRERAQSYLTEEHIDRIVTAYKQYVEEKSFTSVVSLEQIRGNDNSLSISLYISSQKTDGYAQITSIHSLSDLIKNWLSSVNDARETLNSILGDESIRKPPFELSDLKDDLPVWLKWNEWKKLPFGVFTENITTRVEPSEASEEIYVGLEHLDSEDLHIRRWGKGSDVIGIKLRFHKGDLIFGRRRAYQHKLAIAEFDGICSAHAMVLRAKPDVILPEFLPFLMMNDTFMNKAVEISVGSLSPTISWKMLNREEFALPPLDQQQRISDILWALDYYLIKYNNIKEKAKKILLTLSEGLCWNEQFSYQEFRYIVSTANNHLMDGDWIESKDQSISGIRLIQLADIGDGQFLNKSDRYISEETFNHLQCLEVFPGDLLISRMADPIGRACIIPDIGGKMITAVDCAVARVDIQRHEPHYWLFLTNTKRWRREVASKSGGSTRLRISRNNLEKIKVPFPPLEYQIECAKRLNEIASAIKQLESHSYQLQNLLKSFINYFFNTNLENIE